MGKEENKDTTLLLEKLYSPESKAVAILHATYQNREVNPDDVQKSIALFSRYNLPEAIELSLKTAFNPYVSTEDSSSSSSLAYEFSFSARLALKAGDQQRAKALYQKTVAASKDVESDPNARFFTLQDSCRLAKLVGDEEQLSDLVNLTSEALIDKLANHGSIKFYDHKWSNELIELSRRIKDQNIVDKIHKNIISAVLNFGYIPGFEIAQQLGYKEKADEICRRGVADYEQKGWFARAAELAELKGDDDLSARIHKLYTEKIRKEMENSESIGNVRNLVWAAKLALDLGDEEKAQELKVKALAQEEVALNDKSGFTKYEEIVRLSKELKNFEKVLFYCDKGIKKSEEDALPAWIAGYAADAARSAKKLGEKDFESHLQKSILNYKKMGSFEQAINLAAEFGNHNLAKELIPERIEFFEKNNWYSRGFNFVQENAPEVLEGFVKRGIEKGMDLWQQCLNGTFWDFCGVCKGGGSVPSFSEDTLNLAKLSGNSQSLQQIYDTYIQHYLESGKIGVALQYDKERNDPQKSFELCDKLLGLYLEKKEIHLRVKENHAIQSWSLEEASDIEKSGNHEEAIKIHEDYHRFKDAGRIASLIGDKERAIVYGLSSRLFYEQSDMWF